MDLKSVRRPRRKPNKLKAHSIKTKGSKVHKNQGRKMQESKAERCKPNDGKKVMFLRVVHLGLFSLP